MQMIRTGLVALAACMAQGCMSSAPVPETSNAADGMDRGADLLSPFKADLKAALQAGMRGGVPNAISVCRDEAPAIADSYSGDGVQMGRASHRRRNPDNTGPEWVSELVSAYAGRAGGWQPTSVAVADGRRGYVEPIVVQPVCLACHGETLSPDVAAIISEEYPDDQATGFREGDFRGVFWVEYPDAG